MAEHYHDENDIKVMREMRKLAPEDFNAWLGLNRIIGRDNGTIPKKYRELIAVAVSATAQYRIAWKRMRRRPTLPPPRAKNWSRPP